MKIGIAGAGIVGRLSALLLQQRGHQVTLFDRDGIDNGSACSYTAAGMLTPVSESDVYEPLVYALGQRSLRRWPELVQQINGEVFYHTGGSLVVAHRQDQADYHRFLQAVESNAQPTAEQMTMLDQAQLAELEPELAARFHRAAYMPGEAWLCPCCVMPTLGDQLVAAKVPFHTYSEIAAVTGNEVGGEIVVAGRSGERRHAFDCVIDSRGLGAREALPALRGVRGEIIWVRAPGVKIDRLVRLMHPRYRIYIVPRRDDLYLIGATQIESEDRSEISVRSSLELLSAAYSVHPGFAEARVIKTDVNLRPALPDNQPKIFSAGKVLRVNGLFRHGYMMAPAICDELVARIEQGEGYQSDFAELFTQDKPYAGA
ncbi:glycine oxidase [Sinobacterium caligoides]|uniref:D-amino-acid oxidase n=1 Tax=Sinobacterium caligoides TaxID=933926 RepID=A0A3N2DPR2_9GAMM|nr:glycine oxidase ThiO [Sinobacterium caligoides]ROS01619.1 glycine oxidase [Sinobacterium caligoides]